MPGLQDPSPLFTCLPLHLGLRGRRAARGRHDAFPNMKAGASTRDPPHGPGLPPRGLPRPGPARPAVPGLVLAADRLMVLRPLYLGFTILPTVPTRLSNTRGKPLRTSQPGKRPVGNTLDPDSVRRHFRSRHERPERLPENARSLPRADLAPPPPCSRLLLA